MSTSCKDISFFLYADTLMNRLQSIGNSVEPYTIRAKHENDVQQDIINIQQDIQGIVKVATSGGSKGQGNTSALTKDQVIKFAQDVHQLKIDANLLHNFETAHPHLNDGLGKQALSTYNMIIGTGPGSFTSHGHINTVQNSIGYDINEALKSVSENNDLWKYLKSDLGSLGNYYYEQKYPLSSSSSSSTSSAPADLGPLDDWMNNGYKGGVSTSALDTNLGAAVNTNNNQLNTWSTLIQQLDQVAQNVITSLSSLWGTEVSNTRVG